MILYDSRPSVHRVLGHVMNVKSKYYSKYRYHVYHETISCSVDKYTSQQKYTWICEAIKNYSIPHIIQVYYKLLILYNFDSSSPMCDRDRPDEILGSSVRPEACDKVEISSGM